MARNMNNQISLNVVYRTTDVERDVVIAPGIKARVLAPQCNLNHDTSTVFVMKFDNWLLCELPEVWRKSYQEIRKYAVATNSVQGFIDGLIEQGVYDPNPGWWAS